MRGPRGARGEILGTTEDAAKYAAVAEKVKTAVNARFLAPNGNRFYTGNRQTLNALALSIGIVPDRIPRGGGAVVGG